MSIISSIREKSGHMALKRESSRVMRRRRIINLDKASNIGVLYYLPDEPTYEKISAYVRKLQDSGKTVKALGYVHSKRLTGQFLPKLSYDFLYPTGLNWQYKPVSTAARDFMDTEYDILIDLSVEEYMPLLYITGISRARFKAGMKSDRRSKHLDLMIELGEKDGLDNLIVQIDHYLTIINRNDES